MMCSSLETLHRRERRVNSFLNGLADPILPIVVVHAKWLPITMHGYDKVDAGNLAFFRTVKTLFEPTGCWLNLGQRRPGDLELRPTAAWKTGKNYWALWAGVADPDLNGFLADALDINNRAHLRLPPLPDKMLWNNPSRAYTGGQLRCWAERLAIGRLPGMSRRALQQALRGREISGDRSRVEWRVICDLLELGFVPDDVTAIMMRAQIKPRRLSAMERQVERAQDNLYGWR